jgi:DNA-binding response OmpR family regulator
MEERSGAGRALIVYSSFEGAIPITRSVAVSGFVSTLAPTIDLAIEAMARNRYDIVVIAEQLVDDHGVSVIDRFVGAADGAPVLLGVVGADASVGVVLEPAQARPILGGGAVGAVEWGPLRMEMARRMAWWDGAPLRLTPKQFRLLYALAHARGAVCSVAELHEAIFGDVFLGDTERLAAHVRRVRALIELDTGHPAFLLTVRGEGFRLADRPQCAQLDEAAAVL